MVSFFLSQETITEERNVSRGNRDFISACSFDIKIDDVHKEDVFSIQDNSGDITIISINQRVGVSSFSQHVIAISGEKTTATTMTLQGTVTKQSLTSQFVLTATFELLKE